MDHDRASSMVLWFASVNGTLCNRNHWNGWSSLKGMDRQVGPRPHFKETRSKSTAVNPIDSSVVRLFALTSFSFFVIHTVTLTSGAGTHNICKVVRNNRSDTHSRRFCQSPTFQHNESKDCHQHHVVNVQPSISTSISLWRVSHPKFGKPLSCTV